MERTLSTLLSFLIETCMGNPPVTGGFSQLASYVEVLFLLLLRKSCWANSRVACDLKHHDVHVNVVPIMWPLRELYIHCRAKFRTSYRKIVKDTPQWINSNLNKRIGVLTLRNQNAQSRNERPILEKWHVQFITFWSKWYTKKVGASFWSSIANIY